MEPLRTYIDTSVFGGYYDDEFAKMTRPFFELIFAERIKPLLSDTLLSELKNAPPLVRSLLSQVLPFGEHLPITQAAIHLQRAYLHNAVVPIKYSDDAFHVAQATVAQAQVLTSWNFKHLIHPGRTRHFNAVNINEGFGLLVIMSPYSVAKVVEGGDDEPE